jgi:hypothetical protein
MNTSFVTTLVYPGSWLNLDFTSPRGRNSNIRHLRVNSFTPLKICQVAIFPVAQVTVSLIPFAWRNLPPLRRNGCRLTQVRERYDGYRPTWTDSLESAPPFPRAASKIQKKRLAGADSSSGSSFSQCTSTIIFNLSCRCLNHLPA